MSSRAITAALALGVFIGCEDSSPGRLEAKPKTDDPTTEFGNQPGVFAGDESNTQNHMDDLDDGQARDAFEILAQRQEEGPPEIRTRLHSCQKLQNEALINLLTSLGVNLDATGDPPTSGELVETGRMALGAANYDARVGEAIVWTAAGAAKLFDVFVQAAPEIIAKLPNVAQCQIDGVGPAMFDAKNQCNADALACITGRPATPAKVAVCSEIVTKASNVEIGKRIAVATAMAAAHSCE